MDDYTEAPEGNLIVREVGFAVAKATISSCSGARIEAAQSLQGYAAQRCSRPTVPHIRHSDSPGAFTASSLPLEAFVQILNLPEQRELSLSHRAEFRPGLRPWDLGSAALAIS